MATKEKITWVYYYEKDGKEIEIGRGQYKRPATTKLAKQTYAKLQEPTTNRCGYCNLKTWEKTNVR